MANQSLCLKWDDFQDQERASFQELRNDTDFTDVTLACEDQNIKAHKVILSAGLHKLWYPVVRDMSTWSKFGAHGEHGDVFLFSNLGAL